MLYFLIQKTSLFLHIQLQNKKIQRKHILLPLLKIAINPEYILKIRSVLIFMVFQYIFNASSEWMSRPTYATACT